MTTNSPNDSALKDAIAAYYAWAKSGNFQFDGNAIEEGIAVIIQAYLGASPDDTQELKQALIASAQTITDLSQDRVDLWKQVDKLKADLQTKEALKS